MFKNPYVNAVLAAGYIVGIVLLIQGVTGITKDKPDTILIPMTMLSLFVLSAGVMGLLFVYTPGQLFLDNHRKEALTFFFRTLGTFAVFAAVFGILVIFI
jgi:hypothetical protein